MVYIDPKTPRHLGRKGQAAKLQAFAEQRAREARAQKWRILIHGIIISLGIWSFKNTDIHSGDPFTGGTLVLMDMLFCAYLLALLFIEIWRR